MAGKRTIDFAQFAFNDDSVDKDEDNELLNSPIKIRKCDLPTENSDVHVRNTISNADKCNVSLASAVGLTELYCSTNCSTSRENPLRLLIIGHNPSDQSFTKGHFYANPSNRMWPLLTKAGIVPSHFTARNDQECPERCGLGFTDLVCGVSETKSSRFSDAEVRAQTLSLYGRIHEHMKRAASGTGMSVSECQPKILAFSGVRQWKMLFPSNTKVFASNSTSVAPNNNIQKVLRNDVIEAISSSNSSNNCSNIFNTLNDISQVDDSSSSMNIPASAIANSTGPTTVSQKSSSSKSTCGSSFQYGVQTMRPPSWPIYLSDCVVFVLPSSSGAAAMTNQEREGPYLELGQLLKQYPWPMPRDSLSVKCQDNSGTTGVLNV